MQKKYISILFFITVLHFVCNAAAFTSDTLSSTKIDRLKSFFSLQNNDTLQQFNRYTTASDLDDMPAKWKIIWSGMIGFDFFWDTRKPVELRDGGIYLYPTNVQYDRFGKDINAMPSFNFIAMNTRLTLKISAPDVLGAHVSGMIEGWFIGVSNNDMNGFALRHSFLKLNWKTTELLFGQTWHPLFTERMFPQTISGSAGAPFQPFARSPQIRITQQFAKNNFLLLYLNAQRDILSMGSGAASSEYLRNSAIPEMGLQYILDGNRKNDNVTVNYYFGVGGNYKHIIPRTITANNIITKKGADAFTALIFFNYYKKFTQKKLMTGIKGKVTYGQMTNDFLMLGGYAIREYNALLPLDHSVDYNYTAINTLSAWIDIYAQCHSFEFALFSGFSKNMGAFNNIQSPQNPNAYYARQYNIDLLYRISPRFKYSAKHLHFCFEPEYTSAVYGAAMTRKGKVDPSETTYWVHNIRFLFTTIFSF